MGSELDPTSAAFGEQASGLTLRQVIFIVFLYNSVSCSILSAGIRRSALFLSPNTPDAGIHLVDFFRFLPHAPMFDIVTIYE